ncbi:O-antigen ligase family protein [Coraliomargarita parva]|uniref:O-antigen ligase family protein n=1 Tax=Coraliomargarita parva TaxID=3014050 RepID=UPI0022B2E844|nr:O-antigen ligase family protein [Coraliomargarita parva]
MADNETPHILPRDKLLRDSFTPAETLTFICILVTALIGFVAADPRSYWILGYFIIAGAMTLVILKTHEATHPFFLDFLWPRFALLATPAVWILLQYVTGILQDPLHTIQTGKESYYVMEAPKLWLPTSTAPGQNAVTLVGFCSVYFLTICLFLVPKSRSFFERVLPWLCLLAVLTCLYGYLQLALDLEAPLFTKGTGRDDFFAFFPYDGQWAAFAMLWSTACIALALLKARYEDAPPFLQSTAPWYLTGALLLGLSGCFVQAKLPAVLLLLLLSILLLLTMVTYLQIKRDPHHASISFLSGFSSAAVFAIAIFRVFQPSADNELYASLRRAAVDMFRDNPLFGWGMDGFAQLAPFYLDDRLLGARYERAASDGLQFLAEFGLIGYLFPLITFLYLLCRYLKGRKDIQLTNHLLLACAAVLGIGCIDTPFMSPAVFMSFFIIFFSALRWADLSRSKVDEVDARPTLVTPAKLRRVPFYTEQGKETFK